MVTLPSWDDFMVPVLRLQADGEIRSLRSIRSDVAAAALRRATGGGPPFGCTEGR